MLHFVNNSQRGLIKAMFLLDINTIGNSMTSTHVTCLQFRNRGYPSASLINGEEKEANLLQNSLESCSVVRVPARPWKI